MLWYVHLNSCNKFFHIFLICDFLAVINKIMLLNNKKLYELNYENVLFYNYFYKISNFFKVLQFYYTYLITYLSLLQMIMFKQYLCKN